MVIETHRRIWVDRRYRETVDLFHFERKQPENKHRDLVDLSRACAALVFSENVKTIIGSREKSAQDFMVKMRENIGDEIQRAIMEVELVEPAPC